MGWETVKRNDILRDQDSCYITLNTKSLIFCALFTELANLNQWVYSTIEVDKERRLIRFQFHNEKRDNASFKFCKTRKAKMISSGSLIVGEYLPEDVKAAIEKRAKRFYLEPSQMNEISKMKDVKSFDGVYWVFSFGKPQTDETEDL